MRWVKWILKAILIAGFAIPVSLFHDQIGISLGTFFLVLGVGFYLEQRIQRLQERTGVDDLPSPYRLPDFTPINPVHEVSEGIPREGWGITPATHRFFSDFLSFGQVFNEQLEDSPWRVQEVARTDVATLGDDSPVRGRRFEVFFGPNKTGRISISDSVNAGLKEYSSDNPSVHAVVEVWNARLIHGDQITGLLSILTGLIATGGVDEHVDAMNRLKQSMIESAWLADPQSYAHQDLEVSFSGTATRFLRIVALR